MVDRSTASAPQFGFKPRPAPLGYRFVFLDEAFYRQLSKIRQRPSQMLMAPIPPSKPLQAFGNRGSKSQADLAGGIARHYGIGRNILGNDCPGRNDRPVPDISTWQDDRAMTDPNVVSDCDGVGSAPLEKFGVVGLFRKITGGSVGKMRLTRAVHRMVARIDAHHRRYRAELPKRRVGRIRIVDDVRIVVEHDFEQLRPRPDPRVSPELTGPNVGGRMHQRIR